MFRVQVSRFRVQGLGITVAVSGLRVLVQGFGGWVWVQRSRSGPGLGFGSRVCFQGLGSGFRVWV